MTDEQKVRRRLERWRLHPITMVREEFQVEPEPWQKDALAAFPQVDRLAFKASKGVGKTATLVWLIWNFLATRPHCRIAVTSITGDNLNSALWPELAKWQNRSPYLSAVFEWSRTQVVNRAHPATWWVQARTWPKRADASQQAHAMAGLHEDFAMGVLDESSEIPQAVMATVEAVLGTGIDTKVLQAGNPTRLDGPLHTACTSQRKLWRVLTISGDPDNPKRSSLVKREWAQQQIDTYGRDNPWVKVNVLGEFPEASINALLGVDDVERAMVRHLRPDQFDWAQKRLGIDVARFGDDRTVIFGRQGLNARVSRNNPVVLRNLRTTEIAARVLLAKERFGSELELIDDTGHWGHGVIDNLITAGIPAIGVNFAGKALDPRYNNRRSEMWIKGAEAIKRGVALPNLPEMVQELTAPTYTFVNGKFVLEDKDQIKARIGVSPDLADAFMLTYALEDMPSEVIARLKAATMARRDFDPYVLPERSGSGHADRDVDPLNVRI